jgi:hypothetical protein
MAHPSDRRASRRRSHLPRKKRASIERLDPRPATEPPDKGETHQHEKGCASLASAATAIRNNVARALGPCHYGFRYALKGGEEGENLCIKSRWILEVRDVADPGERLALRLAKLRFHHVRGPQIGFVFFANQDEGRTPEPG